MDEAAIATLVKHANDHLQMCFGTDAKPSNMPSSATGMEVSGDRFQPITGFVGDAMRAKAGEEKA
ncbi:MAG: hypothetical protein ACYDAG_07560 [Chloroflexota bacterium]